jgi:hypothetical protein
MDCSRGVKVLEARIERGVDAILEGGRRRT